MSEKKCVCVSFGQRRKVVSLSFSEPGTDVEQLKEGSLQVFPSLRSGGRPIFQQYLSKFEEWLDLEDDTVIENKAKVTVISEVDPLVI